MKRIILVVILSFSLNVFAQLANGTIAPDFTLTDYYGNTHHLYSYLDNGKTVFVEIFAAHCPSCWSYHQTHRMKNMYNMYGPDATDEIMVLALEYDQYNDSNAFTGNHQPWVTAGDWLTGTPYPIFNVEWPDRDVFTDYNVNFYPVIYKICPDKIVERIATSMGETELYEKVQDCQALSIKEESHAREVYFDRRSRNIIFQNDKEIKSISITNLNGKLVKTLYSFSNSKINVNDLADGVYVLEFKTDSETFVKKIGITP
jgi:cytochrome oxidase Cu insertion factor (SCO1/SenC/PrrC family)